MRFTVLLLSAGACLAQTTYLRNDLTAAFRYEVKVGQNSYFVNNAPGFGLKYSFRPRRWLALEAAYEQIPRPIGSSFCCRSANSAGDELYLAPFGVRYVFEHERLRLSAGGGGAYMNHSIPVGIRNYDGAGASAWGGQGVASIDYGITRSGRIRAGLTARYYYVPVNGYTIARLVTLGPDFTFSFR